MSAQPFEILSNVGYPYKDFVAAGKQSEEFSVRAQSVSVSAR
jgi:hypothetical protein